ncbi:hypothetical protein GPJ56_005629 [Histomonas meleagridis]|uniref:uncharacterized protein n=1 Tax=Histomonas meleagridis TaxID=135588 RepID=UPI00355A2823|nr:hypothetical protein GPJ56_005629 [Histomonas meleagridis]KAH0803436.1 hypothetical protein GO595_003780 [Histomonas meleagridis]
MFSKYIKIDSTLTITFHSVDLKRKMRDEFRISFERGETKGTSDIVRPNEKGVINFEASFDARCTMYISKSDKKPRPKHVQIQLNRMTGPTTSKIYGKLLLDVSPYFEKGMVEKEIEMESGRSITPILNVSFYLRKEGEEIEGNFDKEDVSFVEKTPAKIRINQWDKTEVEPEANDDSPKKIKKLNTHKGSGQNEDQRSVKKKVRKVSKTSPEENESYKKKQMKKVKKPKKPAKDEIEVPVVEDEDEIPQIEEKKKKSKKQKKEKEEKPQIEEENEETPAVEDEEEEQPKKEKKKDKKEKKEEPEEVKEEEKPKKEKKDKKQKEEIPPIVEDEDEEKPKKDKKKEKKEKKEEPEEVNEEEEKPKKEKKDKKKEKKEEPEEVEEEKPKKEKKDKKKEKKEEPEEVEEEKPKKEKKKEKKEEPEEVNEEEEKPKKEKKKGKKEKKEEPEEVEEENPKKDEDIIETPPIVEDEEEAKPEPKKSKKDKKKKDKEVIKHNPNVPRFTELFQKVLSYPFQPIKTPVYIDAAHNCPYPSCIFPSFAILLHSELLKPKVYNDKDFDTLSSTYLDLFERIPVDAKDEKFLATLMIILLVNSHVTKEHLETPRNKLFIEKLNDLLNKQSKDLVSSLLINFEVLCNRYSTARFEVDPLLDDFRQVIEGVRTALNFTNAINSYLLQQFITLLDAKMSNKILSNPMRFTFSKAIVWNSFITAFESVEGLHLRYLRQIVNTLVMSVNISNSSPNDNIIGNSNESICKDLSYDLVSYLLFNFKPDEMIPQRIDYDGFLQRYNIEKITQFQQILPNKIENFLMAAEQARTSLWNKRSGATETAIKVFPFLSDYVANN